MCDLKVQSFLHLYTKTQILLRVHSWSGFGSALDKWNADAFAISYLDEGLSLIDHSFHLPTIKYTQNKQYNIWWLAIYNGLLTWCRSRPRSLGSAESPWSGSDPSLQTLSGTPATTETRELKTDPRKWKRLIIKLILILFWNIRRKRQNLRYFAEMYFCI